MHDLLTHAYVHLLADVHSAGFAPEQYRPIGLNDKDLEEYIELISRVIDNLIEQKKVKETRN